MGLLQTIKREKHYLSGMLRMLKSIKDVDAESDRLVPDNLEKLCDKFGPNIAFLEDVGVGRRLREGRHRLCLLAE